MRVYTIWFAGSTLLNDGSGCSNLGLMYEKGKGVKQDNFKALKFYLKGVWFLV
jgi:TPR repeat protein